MHRRPLRLRLQPDTPDDSYDTLVANTTLRDLDLAWRKIGTRGALHLSRVLCRNTSLIHLDLCGNQMDSVGAAGLADALMWNNTLESLALERNPIGNEGAACLARLLFLNRTLETLSLRACRIDAEGAHDLARALVDNHTLLRLDLSKNQIGNGGAHAVLDALKTQDTLIYVNLDHNFISWTAELVETCVAMYRRNTTLQVLCWEWSTLPPTTCADVQAFTHRVQPYRTRNRVRFDEQTKLASLHLFLRCKKEIEFGLLPQYIWSFLSLTTK